jgi:hypothetical protein
MATDLENLATRRSAIYAELAAMTSASSGGKPNYSADGESVDHVGYKASLYAELAQIDQLITALQGPVILEMRGVT